MRVPLLEHGQMHVMHVPEDAGPAHADTLCSRGLRHVPSGSSTKHIEPTRQNLTIPLAGAIA